MSGRRPWPPWRPGWRARSCPYRPGRRTTARVRRRGAHRSSARRSRTCRSTIGSSETIGSRSKDTSRKRRADPGADAAAHGLAHALLAAAARPGVAGGLVEQPGRAVALAEGAGHRLLGDDPAQHVSPLRCVWHRRHRAVVAVEAREARVLRQEAERDLADRAVAVLGEDDVRLAQALGLLVVVLLAIDEHHDVGVLLELAALAQVGEHRHRRVARLDGARELGDRDDGDVELAGEDLQATADLARPARRGCRSVHPAGPAGGSRPRSGPGRHGAACSRRALARISSTPMSLESSMKIGAAASFSTARSTLGQRSALTRPLRARRSTPWPGRR